MGTIDGADTAFVLVSEAVEAKGLDMGEFGEQAY